MQQCPNGTETIPHPPAVAAVPRYRRACTSRFPFSLPPSFQARPFRIGNVAIDFPVVQAALSGYSDWPMRVIARRLGAGYTWAKCCWTVSSSR